ncbi:MipA/OmpV family protein [Elioraea rosea]|uniref:MipA/OmpV family protein n=1 Tax=Elioraea rosea TaxID=2492390 RepID=UPI00131534A1|nr:MipA/OmpV family protein [Elioraea rosea]
MRSSRAAAVALGLLCLAAPVRLAAQELIDRGDTIAVRPTTAWSLTVGALGAANPDYEGSNDYGFLGAPLIDLRYRDLFFLSSRDGLGVSLIRVGGFSAGPLLRYRFGRDQDDNDALRGLGDVGGTVEGGLFARYQAGPWVAAVNAAQGLNGGGHRGATVHATLGYGGRLGEAWSYSLGPSVTWASGNYMQSFFGIDATQSARSGYAVYDADAGFKDVGFGGTLTWRFWDRAAVTAIAEVKELLGDAADSPIVDQAGSSTQAFVGLALSYRFTW